MVDGSLYHIFVLEFEKGTNTRKGCRYFGCIPRWCTNVPGYMNVAYGVVKSCESGTIRRNIYKAEIHNGPVS